MIPIPFLLFLAFSQDSHDYDDRSSLYSLIPAAEAGRALNVLKVWNASAQSRTGKSTSPG